LRRQKQRNKQAFLLVSAQKKNWGYKRALFNQRELIV
jgi:hypothetical protein